MSRNRPGILRSWLIAVSIAACLLLARVAVAQTDDGKTIAPFPRLIGLDEHGFVIHSLAERIDKLSSEKLERELLKAREISLPPPGPVKSPEQKQIVDKQKQPEVRISVETILTTQGRADLASLPFRMGPETALTPKQAEGVPLCLVSVIRLSFSLSSLLVGRILDYFAAPVAPCTCLSQQLALTVWTDIHA